MEETPLQVQMQLLEEMQDMEALVAAEEVEEEEGTDTVRGLPLLVCQQQMEEMVELEELVVMEAAAVEAAAVEPPIFIAPI